MAQQFWFNLPVADVERSREFYKEIGFKENEQHNGGSSFASFFVGGKEVVMMLFPVKDIEHFLDNKVTDTSLGNEVLFNIDAESADAVDAFTEIVEKAGGVVYGKPGWVDGWMYGMGFTDPDGHRWSMLFMDMGKMNTK